MARRKKWVFGSASFLLVAFVSFVGPWPLDTTPEEDPQLIALSIVALEAKAIQESHEAKRPGDFFAGWAAVPFDLPTAVPLAGYGARRGAASEGYLITGD